MTGRSLFWGSILILGGILLLLNSLGLLSVNVWSLIGPFFLIAFGLLLLWRVIAGPHYVEAWPFTCRMTRRGRWGVAAGPHAFEAEEAAIPLEGAARAHVRIRHGAGRLQVNAGTGLDELASGTFGGGLDYRARRDGEVLDVDMRPASHAFPFFVTPWNWGPRGALDWSFGLNDEIPLSLEFEGGASDTRLDLAGLRVTELRLQTGASATDVTLPANAGQTRAEIRAGAASVTIRVPPGVAARIRAGGGLAAVNVDRNRFPRVGGVYQSPDYDAAPNKVDVNVEAGVGSIDIR